VSCDLTAVLKSLGVCLVALIIWFPLKPYGEVTWLFGFNWIAMLLGIGSLYVVCDSSAFKKNTKLRHYIFGGLICPIWLFVRFFMYKKHE
jgi:hypothetical protein